jgi:hypothetical protein
LAARGEELREPFGCFGNGVGPRNADGIETVRARSFGKRCFQCTRIARAGARLQKSRST